MFMTRKQTQQLIRKEMDKREWEAFRDSLKIGDEVKYDDIIYTVKDLTMASALLVVDGQERVVDLYFGGPNKNFTWKKL